MDTVAAGEEFVVDALDQPLPGKPRLQSGQADPAQPTPIQCGLVMVHVIPGTEPEVGRVG